MPTLCMCVCIVQLLVLLSRWKKHGKQCSAYCSSRIETLITNIIMLFYMNESRWKRYLVLSIQCLLSPFYFLYQFNKSCTVLFAKKYVCSAYHAVFPLCILEYLYYLRKSFNNRSEKVCKFENV